MFDAIKLLKVDICHSIQFVSECYYEVKHFFCQQRSDYKPKYSAMKKSYVFMKLVKYVQVGRLLRLDLGVDRKGEILRFRDLTYGAPSSHRHACWFTIRNYSEV